MSGIKKLINLFESGKLVRPDPAKINSIDLYRALARLAGARGIESGENSFKIEEKIGINDHYLFILIDGLGMSFLEKLPESSFLRRNFIMELQAVCPPTTAASLTSLATMQWVCDHAVPGWFLYFDEKRISATILPFIERFTEQPLEKFGIRAEDIFPFKSVWSKIKYEPLTIIGSSIMNSTYTRYSSGETERIGYNTIGEAFDKTCRRVQGAVYPTFTYLYLPQLDSLCHDNGTLHQSVHAMVEEIDRDCAALYADVKGKARIVITADHGLIDVPESKRLVINEGDGLLNYLLCPPSIEPRISAFHVKAGMENRFTEAFLSRFDDDFLLITPDEAEHIKIFGEGALSPVLRQRLGTFIGIPFTTATLNYRTANDKHSILKAVHAGLSREEMTVPLIIT
jgi:hypothetical protein